MRANKTALPPLRPEAVSLKTANLRYRKMVIATCCLVTLGGGGGILFENSGQGVKYMHKNADLGKRKERKYNRHRTAMYALTY